MGSITIAVAAGTKVKFIPNYLSEQRLAPAFALSLMICPWTLGPAPALVVHGSKANDGAEYQGANAFWCRC